MLRNFLKIGAVSVALLLSSSVWAETVIFSGDFTTLTEETLTTNNTTTSQTLDGVTLTLGRKSSSKTISWGGTAGINFGTQNWSFGSNTNFHGVKIPLTSVDGQITVTISGGAANSVFKVALYNTDATTAVKSATATIKKDATSGVSSITISGLTETTYDLYIGENGSSYFSFTNVDVTTGTSTATDEASADKEDDAWYLFNNGAKLDGEPSTPGLYVHDRAVILKK